MIDIYAGKDRIEIGRYQENAYRRVVFPVAPILRKYPDATFVVLNKRKQDQASYPVPVSQITVENGRLYWVLMAADLAYTGEGECELIAYSGSVVAKDVIYTVIVDRALDAGSEPPDGWEDFLADLAEIAKTAVDAKNDAVTAKGEAEAAQGAAERAQTAAESAQGLAEAARDAAILAKTAAETAQGQAEGFATAASGSAGEAQRSANTATSKAGEAAQSASDAAGSASDASGYAQTASEKAGEASDSASAAARDAGTAEDKAGEASQSATDASGYATAASGSASSAAADALKSEGYAVGKQNGSDVGSGSPYYHSNANYYSEQAAGSATTASTKAGEASGSASAASGSATAADTSAKDAEAYAIGKRGGVDVGSSDPAYHNNAKYFSDQIGDVSEQFSELKSDIDGKAPVISREASGDIVSFSDGADGMPLSAVVQIDPVQDTSGGDPSPSNVCPITGRSAVTVTRAGINIWDERWELGNINTTTGEDADASDRIRSIGYIAVKPSTAYYYKAPDTLGLRYYDADKNYIGIVTVKNGIKTTPDNCFYLRFILTNTTTYGHDVSINYPSTDTGYHSGHVQTVTVQLGSTVYSGTIDIATGTLTVNGGIVTYTGVSGENWTQNGTTSYYIAPPTAYRGIAQTPITDYLKSYAPGQSSGLTDWSCRINATYAYFNVRPDMTVYDTVEKWTAYLAEHPLTVLYTLAEPYTVPLTPVQITALRESNIWADTGAVAVTYPADTQTYVDSAITAATDPDGNVIAVTGSTPSITGQSGKRYVCGTVDSLSITPPGTGIIDVVFTSGTTPTVLTVPNTVLFPAWFDATSLDASTVYEINVQDGIYGAVMAWT